MTFLVVVVMLIYGSIKLIHLFDKHNPIVGSFYEKNYFDYKERLDLNQIDFRLAFSVEGYHDRVFKNSSKYVKYFAWILGVDDDEEYEIMLDLHKCEQSDWDQFPLPAESSKDMMEKI